MKLAKRSVIFKSKIFIFLKSLLPQNYFLNNQIADNECQLKYLKHFSVVQNRSFDVRKYISPHSLD